MKSRLEEIYEMIAEVNIELDILIMRHGDQNEIWGLINRRTQLLIEKHDLLKNY